MPIFFRIELEDGILKNFYEEAKDLSFADRGKLLMNTASDIIDAHEQLAQEGQTAAPQENAPVYYHFVAFVVKDGSLWELGNFFLITNKLKFSFSLLKKFFFS